MAGGRWSIRFDQSDPTGVLKSCFLFFTSTRRCETETRTHYELWTRNNFFFDSDWFTDYSTYWKAYQSLSELAVRSTCWWQRLIFSPLYRMSQPAAPEDDKNTSVDNASESAFEFLMTRILLQPASLSLNLSGDINEVQIHPLEILGYDVGYRWIKDLLR